MKDPDCWKIEPIRVATLPVPGWECVFGRNDCALRDLVFWVWVLRCGDKVGLIDTGLPAGADFDRLNQANQKLDARSIFTLERTLDTVFQETNLIPDMVDFVLISQWITYCTGGLLDKYVPRAHIYCAWEGMREMLTACPGHPPREFYLTAESWSYCRNLLIEQRITFAEKPVEAASGIRFDPTGGHHPGSAGVQVRTEQGLVGILETAFIQENIDLEVPIGIAENAGQCREVIRRYKRECDFVLAGHEPDLPRYLPKEKV